MASVLNKIDECAAGRVYKTRTPADIKGLVVHRNEEAEDAVGLADAFRTRPDLKEITGGQAPYHFVITRTGRIEQALPLDAIGAHVRGHNKSTIGICCIGDFRKHKQTAEQAKALHELCLQLLTAYGLPLDAVKGHSEFPNVEKSCPGKYLDVAELRKTLVSSASAV